MRTSREWPVVALIVAFCIGAMIGALLLYGLDAATLMAWVFGPSATIGATALFIVVLRWVVRRLRRRRLRIV